MLQLCTLDGMFANLVDNWIPPTIEFMLAIYVGHVLGQNIMKQLLYLVARFHRPSITFICQDSTYATARMRMVCNTMLQLDIHVPWLC
jgi:hypothetical protein